jgi:hypothetical protein
MDPGRDANGRIFVRPLLMMEGNSEGNSRLPVGTGNEDFEVEGSRNGLIADHARDETILADSSEDACVYTRTRGLHDFKIRGLTCLIDNHADNDLAVIVEEASGAGRICNDINFVDQLGSDDSSRNTLDLRSRSVSGDLGWGRRTCLGMKHNGGQREYGYYEFTHDIYLQS